MKTLPASASRLALWGLWGAMSSGSRLSRCRGVFTGVLSCKSLCASPCAKPLASGRLMNATASVSPPDQKQGATTSLDLALPGLVWSIVPKRNPARGPGGTPCGACAGSRTQESGLQRCDSGVSHPTLDAGPAFFQKSLAKTMIQAQEVRPGRHAGVHAHECFRSRA